MMRWELECSSRQNWAQNVGSLARRSFPNLETMPGTQPGGSFAWQNGEPGPQLSQPELLFKYNYMAQSYQAIALHVSCGQTS